MHRNMLSNNGNELDTGIYSFYGGIFNGWRWNEEYGNLSTMPENRFRHSIIYRNTFHHLATLTGSYPGNNTGSVVKHQFGL